MEIKCRIDSGLLNSRVETFYLFASWLKINSEFIATFVIKILIPSSLRQLCEHPFLAYHQLCVLLPVRQSPIVSKENTHNGSNAQPLPCRQPCAHQMRACPLLCAHLQLFCPLLSVLPFKAPFLSWKMIISIAILRCLKCNLLIRDLEARLAFSAVPCSLHMELAPAVGAQ